MITVEQAEDLVIEQNLNGVFGLRPPPNTSLVEHISRLEIIIKDIAVEISKVVPGHGVRYIVCDGASMSTLELLPSTVLVDATTYKVFGLLVRQSNDLPMGEICLRMRLDGPNVAIIHLID